MPTVTQRVRGKLYSYVSPFIDNYDSYVIGFPKVGNTWLEVMIRAALIFKFHRPEEDFSRILAPKRKLPRGVLAVHGTHHMPRFNEEPYWELQLNPKPLENKNVLILIRNPGDTLVSLYYHNVYRTQPPAYDDDIDKHAMSDIYGIDKFIRFYSQLFELRSAFRNYQVLSYNYLRSDPHGGLQMALTTLGMEDVPVDVIDHAVAYGSYENMRSMEEEGASRLPPLMPSPNRDERARKVRRAQQLAFPNELSATTVKQIEEKAKEGLPREMLDLLDWPA